MITDDLKKQIKIEMLIKNLTVGELAKIHKVSRTYISAIINGKQENLLLETKVLKFLNINDTRTISR